MTGLDSKTLSGERVAVAVRLILAIQDINKWIASLLRLRFGVRVANTSMKGNKGKILGRVFFLFLCSFF